MELSRDKVIAKRLAEIESEDPKNRVLAWTDPFLKAIQQVLREAALAPSTGPAPLVGSLAAALALGGYAAGIHKGSRTYHLQLHVSRTWGLHGFFGGLAGPTSVRGIGQGRRGDYQGREARILTRVRLGGLGVAEVSQSLSINRREAYRALENMGGALGF